MKEGGFMKIVVITGASGLLGTELCHNFLQHGYKVYALDKVETSLKDEHLIFKKCDLSDPVSIERICHDIPAVHVLVNNAARTDLTFKKFEEMTLEDWNEGLKVNLTSYFLMSQFLMPKLKENKGSIIHIASSRHIQSEENTEIYSASKGAINSLTHAMAMTQKHFVRINSISPGWIADPDEKLKPEDHDQHPVGRVGTPADISEMALFLSSDKAGFITGQDFVVDGGMTKKMIYV
jgi:NAD(P)-dependent dehydrogenase (short-subunit alcohol dehydrogenase family)